MRWPEIRRELAARRRLLAALLAGLAVLTGLSAVRPAAARTITVLAAARDLAAGAPLTLDDLRSVALPPAAVPEGALRPGAAVLGRLVAGPVRRGEPLTDVRLVGPALLASVGRGLVAVPLRFADAGAAALLRAGDHVDVLAAPTSSRPPDAPAAASPGAPAPSVAPSAAAAARIVATDVVVLAVTPGDGGFGGDGTLVVVACPPAVARLLAAADATERLSPALRPPGPAP